MPIVYEELMGRRVEGRRARYTDRDTMLYALSIGMGRDPLDPRELAYVYEAPALRTVPTMAAVLVRTELLRGCGFDYTRVLHGEQRLALERPLPAQGELIADARVTAAFDKGADKGAIIVHETRLRDAASGDLLCTLGGTIFARGDGGFGGPAGQSSPPHPLPSRAPDLNISLRTEPNQALWYRLNGDRNPLHADMETSRRAGFKAPILHGLCTYATACKAVIQGVCNYDATRIAGFDVRFSSPVYPGEEIVTDIWVDGEVVSFRCRVPTRDVVVINNGRCMLRSAVSPVGAAP